MKELTEHQKLKEICDVIGFKFKEPTKSLSKVGYCSYISGKFYLCGKELPIKDIIFTQEFINKFRDYYRKLPKHKFIPYTSQYVFMLEGNLDSAVDYIYNLLRLGEK